MAGGAMNRIFRYIAALTLLAVTACSGPAPEAPLAGARIGGPFALTDQAGKTVRDSDFAGKWRIVYFGYTFCPDICPTDMLKLGQAMKLLEKSDSRVAAKIVPIFISVDPERDTPAVIKQYVEQFHPHFVGLTGKLADIEQVAREYAVSFRKEPAGDSYLIGHTQVAYLMDGEGKPITSLPLEKEPQAIADELRRWVR
jgi:protein SCO1/2